MQKGNVGLDTAGSMSERRYIVDALIQQAILCLMLVESVLQNHLSRLSRCARLLIRRGQGDNIGLPILQNNLTAPSGVMLLLPRLINRGVLCTGRTFGRRLTRRLSRGYGGGYAGIRTRDMLKSNALPLPCPPGRWASLRAKMIPCIFFERRRF
jgi:hypothetical protein